MLAQNFAATTVSRGTHRPVAAVFLLIVTALALLALWTTPREAAAKSGGLNWGFIAGSPDGLDDSVAAVVRGPGGTVYAAGAYQNDHPTKGQFSMARLRANVPALNPSVAPAAPLPDTPFLWQQWWDSPAWTDRAHYVTTDPAGNGIFAGSTWNPLGDEDWLIVKRAPNGDPMWPAQYDGGSGQDDQAWALATDASGNVYVAGISWVDTGQSDWVVRKYRAATGTLAWSYSYHWPVTPQGNDIASALAVAADGTSYVGGQVHLGTGAARGAVIKLSPAGKKVWIRVVKAGSIASNSVNQLALRGRTLFVAGDLQTAQGEPLPILARYGTDGRRAWLRTWRGLGSARSAWVNALAVDGLGNPAIAGAAFVGPQEYKAYLVSWSPAGVKRWQRTYWLNIAGPRYSAIDALTADARGNLWGAGFVYAGPSDSDALLLRISPAGRIAWARHYDGGGKRADAFTSVALYGRGDVLGAGSAQSAAGDDDQLLVSYKK